MPEGPQHQAVRLPDGGHLPPVETRFPRGVSGNPGGRPHGSSPRAVLRRKLAENPNEHGEGAGAVARADALLGALDRNDDDGVKRELAFLNEYEPAVKERVNTNTHVIQSIELNDRGDPVPIPGATP